MNSYNVTKKDTENKTWYLVNAEGKVFGRLASQIATVLRGKHKPNYSPFQNTGDCVVVINAEKVKITGNKRQTKIYRWHTGYPGGLKEVVMQQVLDKTPGFAIENAVKGMLPHNALGRKMFRNLRIICGEKHPYASRKLVELKF